MTFFHIFFNRCNKTLLPLLVWMSFTCSAQQDTLKVLVRANGNEKLNQLEHWFNQKFFFSKHNDRIKLLHDLEQLAMKKNDRVTLASITFYHGLYSIAMEGKQHKKGVAQMQKAIALAEKNGQQLQAAYFRHSLGYYYFTSVKNPAEALQNMLQAHYTFDDIGYSNTYNAAGMLDRLGYVYYHLSNFHEAIKYFKMSLENPMENSRRHIGILNSVGQSYRELVDPDNARKYFLLSRQKAILAHDTAWIGISSGDIGRLYLNEKLYTKAKPFMQEYYKCGLAVKDDELIVEALTGLGDIALNSGDVQLALQQLRQAEALLKNAFKSGDMPVQNYVRKQYLFSIFAKAWDAQGNEERALDYLKAANTIRDSIERRARLSKNTSIQQMFEAEQTNSRIQLLKEEKETAEMKEKLYISLGILFIIIAALLYSRQIRERKIQKQKESLLNMEKEMAEKQLASSREQLEEYVRNLRHKAILLDETKSELDSIRQQQQAAVENENTVLNKLNLSTILTEEDWNRFKILFEKVHTGFFNKLKITFPGLTPAETRLCSLIKLEFNSHQMAAMMGISVMSVKKNRQRLRKKINLSKEHKLEDLFADF